MCMACVGAATPEVAVAIGGYAAVRFGRPLERLKALRRGNGAGQADVSGPGDALALDDATDRDSARSASIA
jgi:hypothetical protein